MKAEQWAEGAREVRDENWVVWFTVCHPWNHPEEVGVLWRFRRVDFIGGEDDGWLASVNFEAARSACDRAGLAKFIKKPAHKGNLEAMRNMLEHQLRDDASKNALGALVAGLEHLYADDGPASLTF
jgi:hypothetical protein